MIIIIIITLKILTIGSYVSCTLSATPQATLTHLQCSPNFPSYFYESTLTHEPIVKYTEYIFQENWKSCHCNHPLPSPLLATNENAYIVRYSAFPVNVMRFKKNVPLLVKCISSHFRGLKFKNFCARACPPDPPS